MDYIEGEELEKLVKEDILDCLECNDHFKDLSTEDIADLITNMLMRSTIQMLHDDYESDIEEVETTTDKNTWNESRREIETEIECEKNLATFYGNQEVANKLDHLLMACSN